LTQLLLPFGIIVAGFMIGATIRVVLHRLAAGRGSERAERILGRILRLTVLILYPLIFLAIFWNVDLTNVRLFVLPLLGAFAIVAGGFLAVGASRLLGLDRRQTGSMFTQGAFFNVASLGSIICFAFLGEESLAILGLFRMFEEIVYYLFAYPVAKSYGVAPTGERAEKRSEKILRLLKDPYILVFFFAILFGIALNLSPLERPDFAAASVGWLVSISAFLMMLSIGYNTRVTSMKRYLKPSLAIAVIKFALVPAAVVLLGFLLGLGNMNDGYVMKVLVILASTPPAFGSLVPPRLYQLDTDLTDASWLFNTILFIIAIVPLQYAVVTWVL